MNRAFSVLLGIVLVNGIVLGQQSGSTATDPQTVQMLLRRIDQLEAKVAQLEAKQGAQAPTPTPEAVAETATTSTPMEGMDMVKSRLHIRGFSDVNFRGMDHIHDTPQCLGPDVTYACPTSSFALGQVNLFITSDLSERFKFLSEVVFESDPFNNFGVDVERILLQYSQNDYLNIAAGRYHTAIGYYNTAFHHSTWFQTTTGRPFLFDFEDKGGILPIHNVGVSVSGRIPSGHAGLHYIAEVGNGRDSNSYRPPLTPVNNAVQSLVDENSHKAFNFALFARPDAIRGLQVGFSIYRDVLTPPPFSPVGVPPPPGMIRVGETIPAFHAVFTRPTFEWLNEVLDIRHAQAGGRTYNTPGFYTQVSKAFGLYRPYFRYQYVNAANTEPVFPDVHFRAGPSVGIRYDASDSVALKLQYDRTELRQQPSQNGIAAQVGFTF